MSTVEEQILIEMEDVVTSTATTYNILLFSIFRFANSGESYHGICILYMSLLSVAGLLVITKILSLIPHKMKLCDAALAPFKAYKGNFWGAKTILIRCSTS
ncbi:hypothetical protein MKW94_020893 [Papaver nudicaule]|uniref:Uncharacterized protein n=1 Tax=Papaver nudicaule TaxID=74823 RepID=A0AA41VHS1_PAPNU|nr:hypothetical protein [Papaver nudicaule]